MSVEAPKAYEAPHVRTRTTTEVDSAGLAEKLRARIRGEVRFDDGSRALYSTDASNYRQVPIGVVIPRDEADIIETVRTAREFGAPVLPRGGGTSLAGQCCNVAVVIDTSKYYNRILEMNPDERFARVEPGIVLDTLRAAAEEHHLTFGPDPATHDHCTLGGMMGNNSCGVHSVMAGKTDDNVEELEILTYDGTQMTLRKTDPKQLIRETEKPGRIGQIYAGLADLRDRAADLIRKKYPKIPRRVSGYNLDQLLPENGFHVARALIGSEGTCGTILQAKLKLVNSPPCRTLLVLGYQDINVAADHTPEVLRYGPIGLEAIDDRLVDFMRRKDLHPADVGLLPEGRGWLLVEFGADSVRESDGKAKEAMDKLKGHGVTGMKLFDDKVQEKRVWTIRESGLGATAYVPGMRDSWPGWEDSAVPPEKLGGYLRDFRKLLDKYGYDCSLYGHFGQGCLHCRITFDLVTADGIRKWTHFLEEAADLVLSYGGSLSGEHGDGQGRAFLLPKMFGDQMIDYFREFKAIWDPDGLMNPGKIVNPNRPDENLRFGTGYNPWQPETTFDFPDDHGSFARAGMRCVGVGECRRLTSGTMCPSYMATHEEKHSTRGRARLLFEMLRGEVIQDGWRSKEVRESLDLCLACKGCKGDCPVNVDMATYKAEFLSHYYHRRVRPRSAYAFGLIAWWVKLASRAPRLVNTLSQNPVLGAIGKMATGMAPERKVPLFARTTFRDWFVHQHTEANPGGPEVILWPDTFNNYFHPETAKAAVRVLERSGWRVAIPGRQLCCGRPLYDWGMLSLAKSQLHESLDALRGAVRSGTPIVGLEPSCISVFRDEITNLFAKDEDAERLSHQTFTLAEFFQKNQNGHPVPRIERDAIVHQHCHHKAIMKTHADAWLLDQTGLKHQTLDAGCCGMAGAFGFEKGDHYDVAMKCGERVLLPNVRKQSNKTIIISDGFSCREQIAQTTDRQALHLAEVLDMASSAQAASVEGYPERLYREKDGHETLPKAVGWAVVGILGAGLILGTSWLVRRGFHRLSEPGA